MKLCKYRVNTMRNLIENYPDLKNYHKYYVADHVIHEDYSEDETRVLLTTAIIRKNFRTYFIVNNLIKKVLSIFKVKINVPYPESRKYYTIGSSFFIIDIYEKFDMYDCLYRYYPLIRRSINKKYIILLSYLKAKLIKLIDS